MSVILQILINVFFSLLVINMVVYCIIFFVYKLLFKKVKVLMKDWNKLSTLINTFNLTKLNILANNNLSLKNDINNLVLQFNNIKHELEVIFKNIEFITNIVTKISFSIAMYHIKLCKNDLQLCKKLINKCADKYNAYCQYSDTIANSLDDVIELVKKCKSFFTNNIIGSSNFPSINKLFFSISNKINNLSKLITIFDFKATVNQWFDLSTNLQQITSLILDLYKFQIVDSYLISNYKKCKSIIAKSYSSIITDDLNRFDNTTDNFEQKYNDFVHAYKQLNFDMANVFMIHAINYMNKIFQFVLIGIYANNIIKKGIDDLTLQTSSILANHDQIINSINKVVNYFPKNIQVISWLTSIKNNINDIVEIVKQSKKLIFTEFDKKIITMNTLVKHSTKIYQKKQEIVNLIDNVNTVFDRVINNIKQLNNLYLCYWQLLSMLNNFIPNGEEFYQINNLIKDNLDKVNKWFNRIIHDSNIDHQSLSLQIMDAIDIFGYLYKKIISYAIFQNYATNLMIYANRYHTTNNHNDFEMIQKLYDQKQFIPCIDKLLSICHKKH